MLQLLQFSDSDTADCPPRSIPLAEPTALALERALLSLDPAERRRILIQILNADAELAEWAAWLARTRGGQSFAGREETVAWLAEGFAAKLASSLETATPGETAAEAVPYLDAGLAWRLPALVEALSSYERQLAEFERRLEHEKLESLKELAYGASHEINNPLANIAARAQTLLRDEADAGRQQKLTAIHRQAMRAHEMIADLMLFARPPKLERQTCDLRQLAGQVVDEQRELAAERQIELGCHGGEEPVVLEVDPTQLAVAIGALVTNALEAVADGGRVDVSVRREAAEGHAWAEVSVRDDGPGISDEVRRHMFDPFYSGREAGRGLGFGLSKCWRIVTDHGGQVIVGQSAVGGAEISVLLPMTEQIESD